ncbi:MAG: PIN domain-containing protein [Propionibacteriaceae bacterium]|nr:PIN domain-containing protein [Propionibacteriaceae bacterium]
MSVDTFIDTNILVYAFDDSTPNKRDIAQSLLAEGNFITSTQVLGELYVTLTRKLTNKLPSDIAQQAIQELTNLPTTPITAPLVSSAIDTSIRFQLSYWDSLILEAAVVSGCTTLLTEDLNDGAVIRGVRITNPFRTYLTLVD